MDKKSKSSSSSSSSTPADTEMLAGDKGLPPPSSPQYFYLGPSDNELNDASRTAATFLGIAAGAVESVLANVYMGGSGGLLTGGHQLAYRAVDESFMAIAGDTPYTEQILESAASTRRVVDTLWSIYSLGQSLGGGAGPEPTATDFLVDESVPGQAPEGDWLSDLSAELYEHVGLYQESYDVGAWVAESYYSLDNPSAALDYGASLDPDAAAPTAYSQWVLESADPSFWDELQHWTADFYATPSPGGVPFPAYAPGGAFGPPPTP